MSISFSANEDSCGCIDIYPMKTFLKKSLGYLLGKAGYQLVSRSMLDQMTLNRWDMGSSLLRLKAHLPEPGTVIDLGAAVGEWSRKSLAVYPGVKHLLVDPLSERIEKLDTLCQQYPEVSYVIAAAGEREGTLDINVSDDLDGSGIYAGQTGTRTVKAVRLDSLVGEYACKPPYLLKFDTHGYELPILQGARNILPDTAAIVMECYTFHISSEARFFWEMCAHMDSLGFRVADVADPWPRAYDGALWQMDLIWLRKEHQIFSYKQYQ